MISISVMIYTTGLSKHANIYSAVWGRGDYEPDILGKSMEKKASPSLLTPKQNRIKPNIP